MGGSGHVDVRKNRGDIRFPLTALDGELDRFFESVGAAKQQLNDVLGRCPPAAAQMVEEVFHAVGEIGGLWRSPSSPPCL